MTKNNRTEPVASDPRYNKVYDHLIDKTRQVLKNKLTGDSRLTGSYYDKDVELAMEEEYRVRRFLLKTSGSVESAAACMVSTFQWIRKNRLRDLKDSDFPQEVHMLGSMFLYQPDLAGRNVFYMRHRHNSTIKEVYDMKVQYMAYQLFKAAEASGEPGFTLVTDLSDTPWSRIQFCLLKFFLQLAQYFPHGIALALYIDLPYLCQEGYKVFKYALPLDIRSTLNLISRDQLVKYIKVDNIPPFLGGKCQIEYSGPSVVPKDSLCIVDYGLKNGLKREVIANFYKFYRNEIQLLSHECPWSTRDLCTQLDSTLAKLKI